MPHDAIWGCQLSSRSADHFMHSLPVPPLIAQERTLRTQRESSEAPPLTADSPHAHAIFHTMGIQPF